MRLPNIVTVVADDIAPFYLSCYGGATPTPALDRLASTGVRFNRAYCAAPLCNPSRWAILTGRFCGNCPGLVETFPKDSPYSVMQNTVVRETDLTIARRLKALGYHTGYIGKWHSNFDFEPWPKISPDFPIESEEGDRLLREQQEAFKNAVTRYAGFDHADCLIMGNLDNQVAQKHPRLRAHHPEWFTEGALEYIDKAVASKKPFLLHLANTVPHGPDVFRTLEEDPKYTYGGRHPEPFRAHPPRATVLERMRAAGLPMENHIGSSNAGMLMIDDQVSALQKRLSELGLLEDTIFIFVADHSIYSKGSTYATGAHVPLIISWPARFKQPLVVNAPVSLTDIVPTLMAMCGADTAGDPLIDGENLYPLMTGSGKRGRDSVYIEMGFARAVVTQEYQYITWRWPSELLAKVMAERPELLPDLDGMLPGIFGPMNIRFKPHYYDAEQLYALPADPFCRHNLAASAEHSDTLASMRARLHEYSARTLRPVPQGIPEAVQSAAFLEMARNTRAHHSQRPFYPPNCDAEAVFNFNMPDPALS